MNLEYLENIMNYIFKKYFIPSSLMSVDEGLLRFLGRYAWKVHIPNKPACEGIKYFAMACISTGYLYSFFMYKKVKTDDPQDKTHAVVYKSLSTEKIYA